MHTEMTTKQSGGNKDSLSILLLLAIALCLGVYHICGTVIIAKDGVTFIKYAQQFDTAPVKTMVNEFQHPGYPILILAVHKVGQFLYKDMSVWVWIYSAQSTALMFRLLAIVVMYFIGKNLVGGRFSFWAILLLIFLPKPANYGSDALSDWPHIFFLVLGFLMLMRWAKSARWWLFGSVGVAAGTGYLIRPECAGVVVFGSLWLGLELFRGNRSICRRRAIAALVLLLAGFLATAGPYIKLKGAIFPKKDVGRFAFYSQRIDSYEQKNQSPLGVIQTADFLPLETAKALGELVENVGETLMWFFVPALLIGMYKWFSKRKWYEPEKFLIISVIILNILLMIWLYHKHGYMSGRHTLPLVMFMIFYVPVGLQELACWFEKNFSKRAKQSLEIEKGERFWFLVLFVIGICICVPKLLRPIRMEKEGYRMAAEWLEENVGREDLVAVPDKRISFYAECNGLTYNNGNIPANAVYTVKIFKKGESKSALSGQLGRVEYEYADKREKEISVVIYKSL